MQLTKDINAYLSDCYERNLSASSIHRNRGYLIRVKKFCEDHNIEIVAISPAQADELVIVLLKNQVPQCAIVEHIQVLNRFLKFLVTKGLRREEMGLAGFSQIGEYTLGDDSLPEEMKTFLATYQQRKTSRDSIVSYKTLLSKLSKFCNGNGLRLASVSDLQANMFLDELINLELSKRTVEEYLFRLNTFLKFLVNKGIRDGQLGLAKLPWSRHRHYVQYEIQLLPKEIQDYLMHCKKLNYRPRTIKQYACRIMNAKEFFDSIGVEFASVTASQIASFAIDLFRRGVSYVVVRDHIFRINTLLRYLVSCKLRDRRNKLAKALRNERKPFISASPPLKELPRLLRQVDSCSNLMDVAIFYMFFETGILPSELSVLLVADLELSDSDLSCKKHNELGSASSRIIVRRKDFIRYVAIPRCAELAIRKYLVDRHIKNIKSPYLFPNQTGGAIHEAFVYFRMRPFFNNVDCRQKGPLAIRHAYLRLLFESGADIRTIRKLSGYRRMESAERHRPRMVIDVLAAYRLAHPRA